jgi:hypothetical protein
MFTVSWVVFLVRIYGVACVGVSNTDEVSSNMAMTANRPNKLCFDTVRTHTKKIAEYSEAALAALEHRYFVKRAELEPRVFLRLTDNWVELAVRFVVEDHGIRELKDRISRDILYGLDRAGIGIASSTFDVVDMPPLKVRCWSPIGSKREVLWLVRFGKVSLLSGWCPSQCGYTQPRAESGCACIT